MRSNVYLSSVFIIPPKIWSQSCIWGMADCKYLITNLRHEERYVPVTDTCFPTENMNSGIYLRHSQLQIPDFTSKKWDVTCTWGPSGRKYLLFHPKCEAIISSEYTSGFRLGATTSYEYISSLRPGATISFEYIPGLKPGTITSFKYISDLIPGVTISFNYILSLRPGVATCSKYASEL